MKNSSPARSGGGIKSNKVKHSASPKAEPRPKAVNLHAVHDIGNMKGNHITGKGKINVAKEPLELGSGYRCPVGPTDNVKAVGVGGGRTIHRAGSQGHHGGGNDVSE